MKCSLVQLKEAVAFGALLFFAAVATVSAQQLPEPDRTEFRAAIRDFRAQRLQAALTQLKDLSQRHPGHFDVQHLLAITLDLTGSIEEANQHFRRAVELGPDSVQARINYGANLKRLGRSSEAFSQFSEAVNLDPDNASANFNLGTTYLSEGRFDEALTWLQRAREVQPNLYENGYQLAFCYFALRDYARSQEVLESMGQVPKDRGEFHLLKALVQREVGDPHKADQYLKETLELSADDPQAHAQIASLLMTKGMFQEALPILSSAVSRFPNSDTALLNLARVEFALGKEQALERASSALSLRETPEAHRLVASILDQRDKPVEAAQHYQRALQLDADEDSFYALGYFFLRHWNWETAEKVFSAGLEKFPDSPRLALGRGAALMGEGDDDKATEAFLRASRGSSPPLSAFHLMALSFSQSPSHFEQAVKRFGQFFEESPRNPWAVYYHALAVFRRAEKTGEFPDAQEVLKLLEDSASANPGFFELHRLLGDVRFQIRDWKRSVEAFDQAAMLNPSHVEVRYKLALALRRSGDDDRARSEFQLYQSLKAKQADEAAGRMEQTKKLIVELGEK